MSDGTKKTTNVYFGSAVMATQTINSVGNIISWKHSDPLTGSSVDTRQDGYNGEQKDFEPLGGLLSRQAPPCNVKNALDAYVGRIKERYTVRIKML